MKELSLHILDVTQNSFTAGAKAVDLSVTERCGMLTLVVADNGRGMSPEFLARVTDPFTTTRTTRKVGLGIPLLQLAAQQTGGSLNIQSTVGVGTTVTAVFCGDSIDLPPLGDMAVTVALLCQGMPGDVELTYTRMTEKGVFRFDTREMRAILGPDTPLGHPEITQWMQAYIAEGEEHTRLS